MLNGQVQRDADFCNAFVKGYGNGNCRQTEIQLQKGCMEKDCMNQNIGIGVADKPFIMWYFHSPKDELTSLTKPMHIKSVSNPIH